MSGTKPPATVAPSRVRRRLKRVFVSALVLVTLAIVFHRPLLRFAIERGAPWAAGRAGYQLQWSVNGSITHDIQSRGLRLTGPPDALLKEITLADASLDYSLTTLVREGIGAFMHNVTLKDANVVLDLRQPPKPEEKKAVRAAGIPDYWVDRIELRNISVRLLTHDGDIVIRGLTLVLDEKQTGDIGLDELILPNSKLHLAKVRGKTALDSRKITISDLVVSPALTLGKLVADLSQLKSGALPFEVRAFSGGAVVSAEGRADHIDGTPSLDARFSVTSLADAEVARWIALPAGMKWRVDDLHGHIAGPPGSPRELTADVSLTAGGIVAAGVRADQVSAALKLASGNVTLDAFTVKSGANTIDLTARSSLPPTWAEAGRVSAEADWKIHLPELQTMFTDPSRFAGSVDGAGSVSLKDNRLTAATAKLSGTDVKAASFSIASLNADVSTDAQAVQFHTLDVKLDAAGQNHARISGGVALSDRQHADLSWSAQLQDLAGLMKAAGLQNTAPPEAGTVRSEGKVNFDLADLSGDVAGKIDAAGTAQVDGIVWQKKKLESGTVAFSLRNGIADVSKLDLRLDAQNTASLTAQVKLADRQPVTASWNVSLSDLAAVAQWTGMTEPAPPEAGRVTSTGKAVFNIADLTAKDFSKATAEGALNIDGVVWQKAKLQTAALNFTAANGRVDLKKLDVRLNEQNTVTASGTMELAKPGAFDATVNVALTKLADLSPWLALGKQPAITSGTASVVWKGSGKLYEADIDGTGTVRVDGLKIAGRPDAISLALETKHDGKRAELTQLNVTAGPLRVEASGVVSQTEISIPKVSILSDKLTLLNGSVEVPLALTQTPRPAIPLDEKRPVAIKLHGEKLDVAKLFSIIGKEAPASGVIGLDVQFDGTFPQLKGKAALTVDQLRVKAAKSAGLDPANVRLDVTLADQKLVVAASVAQKQLKTLTLDASLPLDIAKLQKDPNAILDAPLAARLTLPDSDLAAVKRFVPALADLRGVAGLDVTVSGTARAPEWQGVVHAEVPTAAVKDLDMDIKNARARISFTHKRVNLDDVSVTLAGGGLRVSGGVDLADIKQPVFDVRLNADDALIMRDEAMSARADADVTCKGPLAKAEVAGRVQLVRCRVFKEIEFLPLSLPNQLPPPPPAVKARKPPELPAPLDQWTFNVDIVTQDPVRLLGNVLNGSATTDLHVGGTGAKPELVGKVSFDGARVRLPNSRLAITRGRLNFAAEHPFEPTLDVYGDSLVGSYAVTVNAYGSAFDPKVRFTSSPPLSDGEIATLLATGAVAANEQSAAGVAANQAAFTLLSRAYRSVFNKAAPKRYDEEPPKLTFNFSLLGTGTSQPGVTANYEISPKLQATGTVTERGTFRGMLYYMVRLR